MLWNKKITKLVPQVCSKLTSTAAVGSASSSWSSFEFVSLSRTMASGGNNLRRIIVNTNAAPSAIGPYNQAVIVDRTMYISGQIGFDPKTMEIVKGGVENEANQALINMGAILKSVGCTHKNVVKTTVLLNDIQDFAAVNEVYKKFFTSHEPARAAYQAAALPKGAKVEIEAIAALGEIVEETHNVQ